MQLNRSLWLASSVLLLAFTSSTISANETGANPTGTWKWVAPANPDGRIPEITFTLKSQGESLTGIVNKSTAATAITNGVVKGDEISFQTVRAGRAGESKTTYRGKLTGDAIKGTVETVAGGKTSGPQNWEAKRLRK